MQNLIIPFIRNEDSAIAIEYGLIAAGIRLAAIRWSRTPVIKL